MPKSLAVLKSSVSFITDNKGKKRSIVFDLANEEVQELVEDFFDTILASERISEPTINFKDVKKRLYNKTLKANAK